MLVMSKQVQSYTMHFCVIGSRTAHVKHKYNFKGLLNGCGLQTPNANSSCPTVSLQVMSK